MRRTLFCLIWLLGIGACGGGSSPDPELAIRDPAFVADAARVCAAALPALRPKLDDKTHRTAKAVAELVDDRAAKLEVLVDRLRELKIREGTPRQRRRAWIDDWEGYVAGGRAYAAALRTEKPDEYSRAAEGADEFQRRISEVARASDMPDCALDGVPLPPRRGL